MARFYYRLSKEICALRGRTRFFVKLSLNSIVNHKRELENEVAMSLPEEPLPGGPAGASQYTG